MKIEIKDSIFTERRYYATSIIFAVVAIWSLLAGAENLENTVSNIYMEICSTAFNILVIICCFVYWNIREKILAKSRKGSKEKEA